MKTLREALSYAEQKKIALGHFNVSNSDQLFAIEEASRETGLPIIIGASEGERTYFPLEYIAAFAKQARENGTPLFVNADHTYTVEKVKEAIDKGVDAVIFDGAKLPLHENISKTKECVMLARDSGRDVLVEGEIGYIGTSSKVLDEVPEGAGLEHTSVSDATLFVQETGVSLFSPSVGNIHGMLRGVSNPRLDIVRIGELSKATGVPLVLHGGSGIEDADFVDAVKQGMRIVHINTEIRIAYRKALEEALLKDKEEVAPYKFLSPAKEAVKQVILERIRLFARM